MLKNYGHSIERLKNTSNDFVPVIESTANFCSLVPVCTVASNK